jgi:trk system potassium uptake protein TrkA
MYVIVVGAGEVGSNIAESLADSNEVVVVDVDPDRVESLTYEYDVLAMEANGASLSTLEEAGVEKADIVIASTDDDEINVITCGTAKTGGDPFTIARVNGTEYLDTWQRSPGAFGVDFMVGTTLLTAEAIVRVVGLPAARDVDPFAEGQVQMAEFEVPEDSPIADQTVVQADRFESLTFAALLRNGEVEIPRGETVIRAGDKVVVIGSPESVQAFATTLAPGETPGEAEDIVVVGGTDVGYQVARLFGERNFRPRLIEQDHDRARQLAEDLAGTVVLESDATDLEFLAREHVGDADAVVATLGSDEKNLLVSLLARRLGVERTVAVVENSDYVALFETVGVDVAVNPCEVTAEEITRFTREGPTENVALIESDLAEVLEVEVDAESVLADRTIQDAVADLPEGIVIRAITRDGEFVTPRGDTVIRVGDHVVAFMEADLADRITTVI